eukprot:629007-Rhodomonas_salina.1
MPSLAQHQSGTTTVSSRQAPLSRHLLLCSPSSSSWRCTTAGLPTWGTPLGTQMGTSTSGAGQAFSKATHSPAPSSPLGSTPS